MTGTNCPCRIVYPAASSIFSIKIPYPRVGSFTRTWVTAPMMADLEGNPLEEPRTPQMKFTMQLPKAVPAFSILRRSVDLSAK